MPTSALSRWLVLGGILAGLALLAGCSKTSKSPTAPGVTPPPAFFVDVATGSDGNPGTNSQPFRTITHALVAAGEDVVIHVAPGTYDTTTGEAFPLVLQAGQVLLGDTLNKGGGATGTTIFGVGLTPGGGSHWAYSTVVLADSSMVAGFQVDGPYHVSQFGAVAADAGAIVANNTFQAGEYGGVGLDGSGSSLIRGNVFNTSSYGVYLWFCTDSLIVENNTFTSPALPIDMVLLPGKVLIRNNEVQGSGQVGIQVQHGTPRIENVIFNKPGGFAMYGAIRCDFSDGNPIVRGCTFDCALGVDIVDGFPDLGTAGDAGNNDFSAVSGPAVRHASSAAVLAIGNTWQHNPPTAGTDIVVTGTGSVRWGTGAGEIVP